MRASLRSEYPILRPPDKEDGAYLVGLTGEPLLFYVDRMNPKGWQAVFGPPPNPTTETYVAINAYVPQYGAMFVLIGPDVMLHQLDYAHSLYDTHVWYVYSYEGSEERVSLEGHDDMEPEPRRVIDAMTKHNLNAAVLQYVDRLHAGYLDQRNAQPS